jgi:hypothetical protein
MPGIPILRTGTFGKRLANRNPDALTSSDAAHGDNVQMH